LPRRGGENKNMKAIFPNGQSLQPMPTPDVHPNVSGNINSTTNNFAPNDLPVQNTSNTQTAPINLQPENTKSKNTVIFYFLGLIIIVVIIFAYKKIKRNS
jgi:hypothetical protein